MSDSDTRVKFSGQGCELEFAGSEAFVSSQVEKYKEAIQKMIGAIGICSQHKSPASEPILACTNNKPENQASQNCNTSYPNVLHIEGTDVKIIKSVSGSSKAERTKQVALIYLWAKKSVGIDNVPASEIRTQCTDQGCFDQANFSAHIKKAKNYIIVDGKQGSSLCTYKLTFPGTEEAERTLKEMNGAKS
jgi:hypothetical protein